MSAQLIHATCVALGGRGVLLRGPSGAGKSDLALRLIDEGWLLVSDDQTALTRVADRLMASAPEAIAGRLEVRGLGIMDLRECGSAITQPVPVECLVDLTREAIERLPEPEIEDIEGVDVRRLQLNPFEPSAPAKLKMALLASRSPRQTAEASARSQAEEEGSRPLRLVLVTGLSGAGRSTTLKMLEDLGYEVIDNLPLDLLRTIVSAGGLRRPVVIGIDARTRGFSGGPVLRELASFGADSMIGISLLFLDCDDEQLVRRFTETRRRHPLAADRPVSDGIAAERRLLEPLRTRADLLIDTTALSLPDLRRQLAAHFALDKATRMSVFVTSFSYRHGLPRQADLVFDVRFLSNPHYRDDLRALTGLDPAVRAFIDADTGFPEFFVHLTTLLAGLLPRYEREGKSYLTLAVGCTGGRHRSVAVAEKLGAWLAECGFAAAVEHRDLGQLPDDPRRTVEPEQMKGDLPRNSG